MTTLKMINEAENNNKTYKCDNGFKYNKKLGLHYSQNDFIKLEYINENLKYVNDLFRFNSWEEEEKIMTIEQVEKELGYKVMIITCLNCYHCGIDCNNCENYNKHSLIERKIK